MSGTPARNSRKLKKLQTANSSLTFVDIWCMMFSHANVDRKTHFLLCSRRLFAIAGSQRGFGPSRAFGSQSNSLFARMAKLFPKQIEGNGFDATETRIRWERFKSVNILPEARAVEVIDFRCFPEDRPLIALSMP